MFTPWPSYRLSPDNTTSHRYLASLLQRHHRRSASHPCNRTLIVVVDFLAEFLLIRFKPLNFPDKHHDCTLRDSSFRHHLKTYILGKCNKRMLTKEA